MRIFKEEQRFNQLWLIILISISTLIPLGLFIKAYLENPDNYSSSELIGLISIFIVATGLIFFVKLSSRIDEIGIHYKFFPIHWNYKTIKWSEIEKAYIRTYDPITDYGGWGLKGGALWNRSKGQAINISGDIGIQLKLKNGKKLLLGTQKQENAKSIIAYYKSKFN